MTAFETFIQAEMPKRSALETNASVSYDDNPNLGGAPAALQNAPTGTWFFEQTKELWWRKAGAGSTSWRQETVGRGNETEEDFTLQVLPGSGTDHKVRITNSGMAAAIGAFASVEGALDALPDHIRGTVRIELDDGVHQVGDEFCARFARHTFAKDAKIVLASLNGLVQTAGTTSMGVTSSAGGMGAHAVTLDSDPGLVADAYQDHFLYVVSGTKTGVFKPIRSHTGVTFNIAGDFETNLDNTSVVEIRQPAATLEFIGDTFNHIVLPKAVDLKSGLVLESIDCTNGSGAASVLNFYNGAIQLLEGTRILDLLIWCSGTIVVHQVAVVAIDLAGGLSVMHFYRGGYIRSDYGGTSALYLRSSVLGIGIRIQGAGASTASPPPAGFLYFGQQFDGFTDVCIEVNGPHCRMILGETSGNEAPACDNSPDYAVRLKNGAHLYIIELADIFAALQATFEGTIASVQVDGVDVDWSEVEADEDNIVMGPRGSSIYLLE